MAQWPTTLPRLNRTGYSISPVDQTVSTGMESGKTRRRRITRTVRDKISCTVLLTDNQLVIFRNWFYSAEGADGGAGNFQINLPTGFAETDETVELVEASFSGPANISSVGKGYWEISINLEVRHA